MSEPSGTQYGGFWIRLVAFLADSAILFLISAALLVGAPMFLGPEGLMPAAFAALAIAFLYWPVMHASGMQATFGKAITGLKVARLDGRRISIIGALWREIAKIFSAGLAMLGYLMAAFMPRKQGLHDVLAGTYVVKEGASGIIPAFAVTVAGVAVPVFAVPMVGAADPIPPLARMAEGLVNEHAPALTPALKPILEAALPPAPAPKAPTKKVPAKVQAAKAPVAPPKAEAPKPPVVTAPPTPSVEPPKAEAPKPEPAKAPVLTASPAVEVQKPAPVAIARQSAPVAQAVPEKPKAAPAKPRAVPAKAKAAPAKPETAPTRAVAQATKPAAVPASQPKLASGMRYNDVMTAVLYRDVDAVNELLRLGRWVDKPDRQGATPLMVAAQLGDVRVAEALLRAGADARRAVPVAEERGDVEMIQLLKRYK